MTLDKDFEVRTLVANKLPDGSYGDIYTDLPSMLADHPNAEPIFGYALINSNSGKIPAGIPDWYDNMDDLIRDYQTLAENMLLSASTIDDIMLRLADRNEVTLTVRYIDGKKQFDATIHPRNTIVTKHVTGDTALQTLRELYFTAKGLMSA